MIGDAFWEYFFFPLTVLFAGLLMLILEAWLPLLVISLLWLIIYSTMRARKKRKHFYDL